VRAITEIVTGFPGCWLTLAVLILLVVFLARTF
jgi:hypothetical protein